MKNLRKGLSGNRKKMNDELKNEKKNEETKRQNEMMRDCCLTSSGKYNAYSGREHVIVIEISTLLCTRPTR